MDEISLYPDQKEFISTIRYHWKEHKRIVGMLPTGGGKTRCAAYIIRGYVLAGMKVLFLVPRISLIEQTANAFSELGLDDVTYLWGDYDTCPVTKITIGSMDTFIRREKQDYDLIIVDELQHRRKKLLEWMSEYPDDRYLGLTATPYAPWIGQYYTALAKGRDMKWMIENKRLAPYDVYCPSSPDLSKCKTVNTSMGRDYKENDIADVMGDAKLVGNVVQNWLENGENRPTVGLCVNKLHAGQITNEFNRAGVTAELVIAETPVEERQQIFSRVKTGKTKILLSVDCLTEGFDMPEISCLINARPTRSKTRFVQGIGRTLRYMEGKRAIIFDHAGSFLDPDLGFVEDITIDSLNDNEDGLQESKNAKEEEKKEKAAKSCPKCHYLKPAGVYVCPNCGFKPVAGEDVETDESRGLTLIKGKKRTREDSQAIYSQLIGYRNERQLRTGKLLSDGWVSHTYKEITGVWPRKLSKQPIECSQEIRNIIRAKFQKWAKNQGVA